MAIGIHAGVGSFSVLDTFGTDNTFTTAKLTVVGAFHALVMHGIPERFPQLRIGAIEVTAQWLPYVLHDMRLRYKKQGAAPGRRPHADAPAVRGLPDR